MSAGNKIEDGPGQNDYLWEGSGEPDPEVRKLETLLGKFQHRGEAPVLAEHVRASRWGPSALWARMGMWSRGGAVAAVVVVAVLGMTMRGGRPGVSSLRWDVARMAGAPRVGTNVVSVRAGLSEGQVLETDGQSRANLWALGTGEIVVEPDTRLRLVRMTSGLQRLALERGTIHARIWAPAGQFVVDTPSALAVDLGCAYTLRVDDLGGGMLRTTRGWVGFRANGRESFIPAGAACATRPGRGPGTPYFEDAPGGLRAALAKFDFMDTTAKQQAEHLSVVLAEARTRDALTLWHLLTRVDEAQRASVYERLAEFVPPPADVTREGVLRLDRPMLDLWWNQLGFDEIEVWRLWERTWTEHGAGK
jgi:hypothetical protein